MALRNWPTEVRRDAADRFKSRVEQIIRAEHARGSGPDGASWAPAKDGSLPKLDRSGRMKDGYTFTPVLTRFGISLRIDNRMPYSKFVNKGTPKMVRRPVTPIENSPVPREWSEAARQSWAEAQVAYWRRHRVR